jgi:hypothetical protein
MTTEKRQSLAKQLFDQLLPCVDGLSLYSYYMKNYYFFDRAHNLSVLRYAKQQRVYKAFYKFSRPDLQPSYFNVFTVRDCFRLAKVLDIDIVIYTKKGALDYDIAIDTRLLIEENRQLKELCGEKRKKKLTMFEKKYAQLSATQKIVKAKGTCTYFILSDHKLTVSPKCLDSLIDLTSLKDSSHHFVPLADVSLWRKSVMRYIKSCPNAPDGLFVCWAGQPRALKNKRRSILRKSGSMHFSVLDSYQAGETDNGSKNLVICVMPFGFFVLNHQFSSLIAEGVRAEERDTPMLMTVSNDESTNLCTQARVKRAQRNAKFKRKLFCKCDLCTSSQYEQSMAVMGPQKLHQISLDIEELLICLGQASKEHLDILERLNTLSIASMDIESRTIELDAHLGRNGGDECDNRAKYIQVPVMWGHIDELTQGIRAKFFTVKTDHDESIFSEFSKYLTYIKLRQSELSAHKKNIAAPLYKIIKSYKDAHYTFYNTYERQKRDVTSTFSKDRVSDYDDSTADDDDDDDAGDNTESHWNVRRKKKCTKKSAFVKKAYRSTDENEAWSHSMFGQLEKHLNNLVNHYRIFTFYGSGYDHVLLANYLIPLAYEANLSVKVQKRGTSVSSIVIEKHIEFRDICKLLAPGINLRKFGQMYGLEQEKAFFPFSYLTSVKTLNERKLPTDIDCWKSHLGAHPVNGAANTNTLAQQEANARISATDNMHYAQALFKASNCCSIGDYLQTYLRLDIEILYKAVQLWRQSVKHLTDVDFIDAAKHTMSSLSYYASNKFLMKKIRPGNFTVNNAQIYRLLREGMRGGLCTILRNQAGLKQDGTGGPSHNGHWLPTGGEESRYVQYYDATALYPSSGERLSHRAFGALFREGGGF